MHHFLHRHLLACLIGAYVVSAIVPGPGVALRAVSLATLAGVKLSAPFLLLSFLLFGAGLGASIVLQQIIAGWLSRARATPPGPPSSPTSA